MENMRLAVMLGQSSSSVEAGATSTVTSGDHRHSQNLVDRSTVVGSQIIGSAHLPYHCFSSSYLIVSVREGHATMSINTR